MTIYTIIKQRDNHTDYCRSCEMGSSNSEFETFVTDDKDAAIKQGVKWQTDGDTLTNEKLNGDYRDYRETQVIVLVNGWMGYLADNSQLEDPDGDVLARLEDERRTIEDEINEQTMRNIVKYGFKRVTMNNIDIKELINKVRNVAQSEINAREIFGYADKFFEKISPEEILSILDALEAAQQRIAELESKQQWISVKDRLPAFNIDVQIYCKDGGEQMVGYRISDNDFSYASDEDGRMIVCEPSHWMPIPPAPEGNDGNH